MFFEDFGEVFAEWGDAGCEFFRYVGEFGIGEDGGFDVFGFGEFGDHEGDGFEVVGLGGDGLDAGGVLEWVGGVGDDDPVAVAEFGEFGADLIGEWFCGGGGGERCGEQGEEANDGFHGGLVFGGSGIVFKVAIASVEKKRGGG